MFKFWFKGKKKKAFTRINLIRRVKTLEASNEEAEDDRTIIEKKLVEYDSIKKSGNSNRSNTQVQNKLLIHIFENYTYLKLDQSTVVKPLIIYELCNIAEVAIIDFGLLKEFRKLNSFEKAFVKFVLTMESLKKLGFADDAVYVTSEVHPEAGIFKIDYSSSNPILLGKLLYKLACNDNPFFKYSIDEKTGELNYQLKSIAYWLTSKGYDSALQLVQHKDNERKYFQQISLTRSSRNIAATALFMAMFIAIGSIGNLLLNLKLF